MQGTIVFKTEDYGAKLDLVPSTFTFALYRKNGDFASRLFKVTHKASKEVAPPKEVLMRLRLDQVEVDGLHITDGQYEIYEMVIGVEEWKLALVTLDIGRRLFFFPIDRSCIFGKILQLHAYTTQRTSLHLHNTEKFMLTYNFTV